MAREMMFGFRDAFAYFECGHCGALQIADVPVDLAKYYPPTYYAFAPAAKANALRRWLKRRQAVAAAGARDWIGARLVRRYGVPPPVVWARQAGVAFDDAILDVGSGQGHTPLNFQACGFSNVTGIDPYVSADVQLGGGARVRRCSLAECDGEYDFVMLHHSFEHIAEPTGALRDVCRVLKPGRIALIRTPVAGSRACVTYGTDWVQLDAPRHLVVHTVRSIEICAREAGLDVTDVVYDSTAFQFWGSEQYRRDIPLHDERSYASGNRSIYGEKDIEALERRAAELNAKGEGDQACFYLRRR